MLDREHPNLLHGNQASEHLSACEHGAGMGPAPPAPYQGADGLSSDTRPLGQHLLGRAGCTPVLPEQGPKSHSLTRGHNTLPSSRCHGTAPSLTTALLGNCMSDCMGSSYDLYVVTAAHAAQNRE